MSRSAAVLSRETVKALDRLAIERFGIPGIVLMENAGSACARMLLERLAPGCGSGPAPGWREPVLVLAGPGNNGGDGFVIARHLHNHGIACQVALIGRAARLKEGSDAAANLAALRGTRVPFFETETLAGPLAAAIGRAGCVVDALFGTGLDRPLSSPFPEVFAACADAGVPVLAVDVPSGLDAETGEVLGAAIRAALTPTFVAAKPGLFRGAGPTLCGEVVVVPISIPRGLVERALRDEKAFRDWAAWALAAVDRDPHDAS